MHQRTRTHTQCLNDQALALYDVSVPIRSSQRLPRKFRRPVSPETRSLVARRYERQKRMRWDRWIRQWRRFVERLAKLRRHLLIAAVGLVAIGVVIFFAIALFSPVMRLSEVRVVRTDTRLDLEEVQHALAPLFGRHLLLLSAFEVRQLLEGSLPDLQSVSVGKDYPSTLVVKVTLDPLRARLVIVPPEGETPGSAVGSGSTVDFLTEKGIYISSTRVGDVEALPILRIVDWGARPVNGTAIMSPDLLSRMDSAEHALQEEFGQPVLTRTIYLRAQEFHLQLKAWAVWFDMRSTLEDQLLRYRTFLREVPPAEVRSYVDLRLKDRVVYK